VKVDHSTVKCNHNRGSKSLLKKSEELAQEMTKLALIIAVVLVMAFAANCITEADRRQRNEYFAMIQKANNDEYSPPTRRKQTPRDRTYARTAAEKEDIRNAKIKWSQDQGTVFRNRQKELPRGDWREYDVGRAEKPKGGFQPGAGGRGSKRVVIGNRSGRRQVQFTNNHYVSFSDINKGGKKAGKGVKRR
jgi:guanyl-specific ribonuclease Sa